MILNMRGKGVEATVIVAKCCKTGKLYDNRVEKKSDGKWHFTWSFKLNQDIIKKEGYDKSTIVGAMVNDDSCKGCPYCGNSDWLHCDVCGKMNCYDGERKNQVCGWCNTYLYVYETEHYKLKGGEF